MKKNEEYKQIYLGQKDDVNKLEGNKVQRRIDLGIWDVTEEEVQKLIAEYEKRSEQYEFQQYLRLKKKFDGRESEFSSNVQ